MTTIQIPGFVTFTIAIIVFFVGSSLFWLFALRRYTGASA